MYFNQKSKILPVLAAVLGAVTMVLRRWLYAVALDEKNLLVPGHFLSVLLWLSFLVAAVVIGVNVLRKNSIQWETVSCKPNWIAALGAIVLAAAMGWSVYTQQVAFTVVEKLNRIVGMVCIPCLLVLAFCRVKGVRPFFLCNGLV